MDIDRIDYSKFDELSQKEQTKIKIEIINSTELIKIPVALLPNVHSEEYYFISYSHKDYKEVYKDLFFLENEGFEFWYDRGIPAGSNWVDVANKYIVPFACKGVIFYISENSLVSDAVYEEMQFVKKQKKPFVCIHIPFKSDYVYNGENVKGKVFSIRKMIEIMSENGVAFNSDKTKKIFEMFPDEVLYLNIEMNQRSKIEKIKLILPEMPLLLYDNERRRITGVNDINVNKISAKDFLFHFSKKKSLNKVTRYSTVNLDDCAFSNLRSLESINLPKSYSYICGSYCFSNCYNLKKISNFHLTVIAPVGCFYNCYSLKDSHSTPHLICIEEAAYAGCKNLIFDFKKHIDLETIGERAFMLCEKIEIIDFSDSVTEVGDFAFIHCSNLKTVNLNKVSSIGRTPFNYCPKIKSFTVSDENESYSSKNGVLYSHDFKELIAYPCALQTFSIDERVETIENHACYGMSGLKTLLVPSNVTKIGSWSFSKCKNLKKVVLGKSVQYIGSLAFWNCENLETVFLPKSINFLSNVFVDCPKLKNIFYEGNVADLENKPDWLEALRLIGLKRIHCADGDYVFETN